MKYKIKEVSKITNVPVDTLRYLEKIGIIHPHIDENNRYRYYNAWDINFIFEYMNYRKLEYSTAEIIHYLYEATLSEQIDMIKDKQMYYDLRKNKYDLLSKRNQFFLNETMAIDQKLNTIDIVDGINWNLLFYRENYTFDTSDSLLEILPIWLKNFQYLDNIVTIPKETLLNKSDNMYHWSLALTNEMQEILQLPIDEHVFHLAKSKCIQMLVDAGGEGNFHYHLLDKAMKYIEDHNFKLIGDPYGILLTRCHSDKGFHRYILFYLPIEI